MIYRFALTTLARFTGEEANLALASRALASIDNAKIRKSLAFDIIYFQSIEHKFGVQLSYLSAQSPIYGQFYPDLLLKNSSNAFRRSSSAIAAGFYSCEPTVTSSPRWATCPLRLPFTNVAYIRSLCGFLFFCIWNLVELRLLQTQTRLANPDYFQQFK